MQRFFDIIFSGVALVIFSPLFVLLIIILRITGEGEVFFKQNRVGFGRNNFKLYKFATMLKDSPNIGTGTVTVKNDPRVLPIGAFLRKTKINELPQLINVFKGDMSVIGPRPQTKRCFDAFPLLIQNEITKVRPGLSGIGSIIFRNEEEMMSEKDNPDEFYDEVIMPYKGSLENWYVSKQNIGTYTILIFLTIFVVMGFGSNLVWLLFKDLPVLPKELEKWM